MYVSNIRCDGCRQKFLETKPGLKFKSTVQCIVDFGQLVQPRSSHAKQMYPGRRIVDGLTLCSAGPGPGGRWVMAALYRPSTVAPRTCCGLGWVAATATRWTGPCLPWAAGPGLHAVCIRHCAAWSHCSVSLYGVVVRVRPSSTTHFSRQHPRLDLSNSARCVMCPILGLSNACTVRI
jgi:hypothetical protein